MERGTEIATTQGKELTSTLTESMAKVLRELPKADVLKEIAKALDKTALLFQIPGWNQMNSIVLSEWVFENYKSDQLRNVIAAIQVPPPGNVGDDKIWRLTPDTIREWVAFYLEKNSEAREKRYNEWKIQQQEKYESTPNEWTSDRLKEWEETLNQTTESKKVSPLTEKEIQDEGQHRPKKRSYIPPTAEYLALKELHIQWSREFHHLELLPPNNKKENWIPFETWLQQNQ